MSTHQCITRRRILCDGLAAGLALCQIGRTSAAEPSAASPAGLAFAADGKQYAFDTGALRGTLRFEGRSLGLTPVVDVKSAAPLASGHGLFSHYRLLDADARYGHGAWDWPSTARLLPDGAVETTWKADAEHPFDMQAVYRFAAPGTFDVTTSVVPQKDLRRLEVFLSSYFQGFATSRVYVQGCDETGNKPVFLEAKRSTAVWQMFPRDEAAVHTIRDGRWQRSPNPVDWKIMPRLALPLAMRRDAATGMTALVMAPTRDCFAISTPYSGEGHRSLYLSLFGRDLAIGQIATARSRLLIGRDISDERAVALCRAYLKDLERDGSVEE